MSPIIFQLEIDKHHRKTNLKIPMRRFVLVSLPVIEDVFHRDVVPKPGRYPKDKFYTRWNLSKARTDLVMKIVFLQCLLTNIRILNLFKASIKKCLSESRISYRQIALDCFENTLSNRITRDIPWFSRV